MSGSPRATAVLNALTDAFDKDKKKIQKLENENKRLNDLVISLQNKLRQIIGVDVVNETKTDNDGDSNIPQKLVYTSKWDKNNIDMFDTFIFDCDGVIYRNKDKIKGCDRVLKKLTELNKLILFVSNSSTKDTQMYIDKIDKVCGVKGIKGNQIINSGISTAIYVKNKLEIKKKELGFNPKIYLIGEKGLYNTLCKYIDINTYNIIWCHKDVPNIKTMSIDELSNLELDKQVVFVVVSFYQKYGYNDISLAVRYLHELKHTTLVGTNEDVTYPTKKGVALAGSGSLIKTVKLTLSKQKQKDTVFCGKPESVLFDVMKDMHKNMKPNKCIIFGDRINTDIQFGLNSGMKTCLVFTGITNKNDLETSDIKPHYIMDSIDDLL